MPLRIERRPLALVSGARFDRLIGDRFFASRGFAEVWQAKGGRPVAWTVEADGELAAVLPGIEFGRGPWARFQSMPDGCYGGLFVDPEARSERLRFAAGVLDAVARRRYVKAHIFDFYRTLPHDPRYAALDLQTTLLDIAAPGWLPPDRKLQAQIRKAEREGIACEPFDWARHREPFLQLVELTERRHGRKPAYPPAFFAALARLAQRDARLQWVWCAHGGLPACSHIYVLENGVLQGWQIYYDKRLSFLKPNQYIRFVTCRRMAAAGVARLNLGGTPENAPGLAYYKRRWGGQPIHFEGLVIRSGLGRFL